MGRLRPDLAAIVLCGGLSRRMGRDKASLPFGGETLLGRVVRIAAEAADPVCVVAAAGQVLPALPRDVAVVRDPEPGVGPLGGLAGGLDAIGDRAELAFVTATDAPGLEPGWIAALAAAIGPAEAAVPVWGGRLQPLSAVYRRPAALRVARALLGEGRFRMTELVEGLDARVVDPIGMIGEVATGRVLANLNTIGDYEAALATLGGRPGPVA